MNSEAKDNLDYLLILSLEGAITVEQVRQLNLLMRDSAEKMQYCIDFISIAACLRKSKGLLDQTGRSVTPHHLADALGMAIERDEQIREEEAAHLDNAQKAAIRKAAEEAFERFLIEERRRQEELAYKLYVSRRRRLTLGIGSFAALLTIGVCFWLLGLRSKPPIPTTVVAAPTVAAVTHAYEARWNLTDAMPTVGTVLSSGPLKLAEGVVEIRLKAGARVIVEAPAEMILVSESEIYLTSGALTAYAPEPVSGFVVETPSVQVTDLGTQFGLSVSEAGATDVHMFSGSARALLRGVDGDELLYTSDLQRNTAMRFDAIVGKISRLDLDRERFALSWDDVLYRPRVSGAIKFQRSVSSSLRENAVQSDESIHLFLEATDVKLTHDVTVDVNAPGQYEVHQGLFLAVEAGLKIDSYLIHWDPASEEGRAQSASGSVTFRRPIAGLITTAGQLGATDSLFGAAATEYATDTPGRGLENQGDSITLSQDRLTLQVRLCAPTAVDEIRILVVAPTARQQ